jgi:hypothetical protein
MLVGESDDRSPCAPLRLAACAVRARIASHFLYSTSVYLTRPPNRWVEPSRALLSTCYHRQPILGRIDDSPAKTSEQFPTNTSAFLPKMLRHQGCSSRRAMMKRNFSKRESQQAGGAEDEHSKTVVAGRRRARIDGVYPCNGSSGAGYLAWSKRYQRWR